jgi:hypothetical protein
MFATCGKFSWKAPTSPPPRAEIDAWEVKHTGKQTQMRTEFSTVSVAWAIPFNICTTVYPVGLKLFLKHL